MTAEAVDDVERAPAVAGNGVERRRLLLAVDIVPPAARVNGSQASSVTCRGHALTFYILSCYM